MKKLLRKLLGTTTSNEERRQQTSASADREKTHKHEIPSKEISERFGRAIERLTDK